MIELQVPDSPGKCARVDLLTWRGTVRSDDEGCGAVGNNRCSNIAINSHRSAGTVGLRGCITDNTKNRTLYINSDALYRSLENTMPSSGCSNGGTCCSPSQTNPRPTAITCIVVRNGYSGTIPVNGNLWVTCSGSECVANSDDPVVLSVIAESSSTCTTYEDCGTGSTP